MSAQQGKAALEDAFRYCEEQFDEDTVYMSVLWQN